MGRPRLIYRRTETGWTDHNQKNKGINGKHNCDICGEKLWVNPGGGVYCNGNWTGCKPKEKK